MDRRNPNIMQNVISIQTGQMMETNRLIKFPTITKLSYEGYSSVPNKNMFKTTLSKLNSKSSYPLPNPASITQGGSFRVVEVQPDDYVIKISMMSINQPTTKPKQSQMQYSEYESENILKSTRKTKLKPNLFKQRSASLLTSINYANLTKRQSQPNAVKNISKTLATDKNQPAQSSTSIHIQQPQDKMRSRTKSLIKLKIGQNAIVPQSKININQLYFQIVAALALINGGVTINQTKSFQRIRRAKIEKGNNGYLIKQIIKKRSWWNITEQSIQSNLIWTEKTIRNIKPIQNRQCFYINIQKENQKKVIFQRNIDQSLSYYPKMLQLFFTDQQINKILNVDSKFKKSYTIYNFLTNKKAQYKLIPQNIVFYNHIPNNFQITSKKMLYKNLLRYYSSQQKNPYEFIPNTYHLTAFDWQQKVHYIKSHQKKNTGKATKLKSKLNSQNDKAWFLKPGQNTNRGRGIQMFKSTGQAVDYIMRNPPKSQNKTYILQQYINPLLYDNRKFDIRCYLLCIQILNTKTYYWYEQGYVRTSSSKFSMSKTSISIHLTNDAVQKQMDNYDKYQSANKLSYNQIDKYIANQYGFDFIGQIVPRMKKIAADVCKAAVNMGNQDKMKKNQSDFHFTDEEGAQDARKSQQRSSQNFTQNKNAQNQQEKQDSKQQHSGLFFQIFGLDFIISKNGSPYLLQVNTNPCLQINNNLLSRIIPDVVQNTFRLVTDVYLPNKSTIMNANNSYNTLCPDWAQSFVNNNRFSLLYRKNFKNTQNSSQNSKQIRKQSKQLTQNDQSKKIKTIINTNVMNQMFNKQQEKQQQQIGNSKTNINSEDHVLVNHDKFHDEIKAENEENEQNLVNQKQSEEAKTQEKDPTSKIYSGPQVKLKQTQQINYNPRDPQNQPI